MGKGEGEEAPPLNDYRLVHPMSLLPLKAGRPLNVSAINQRAPALQVQGAQTVKLFYIKKL